MEHQGSQAQRLAAPETVLATTDIARRLLCAAQAGDERAFRELVEIHRPALQAHCYRMLGSLQDSEDAFQDTLLRAWRSLDSLAGDDRLRGWLYRIATNVCLTALRRAERRALPVDLDSQAGSAVDHTAQPASDVRWIGPFPDGLIDDEPAREDPVACFERREAIELAFIAALQHLPPRQRAALVLADVLGFSAAEIAVHLETTVTAVNSALQRSREALRKRLPDRSQQANARAIGHSELNQIAGRFVAAFEAGDVQGILDLLTEDIVFEMPPYSEWTAGREAVAKSWLMPRAEPAGLRCRRAAINGQLAFGVYSRGPGGTYLPAAIDVLTLAGAKVERIVAFRSTEAFSRFGLPVKIIDGEMTPTTAS